ncbi:MAG TPA: hypothetical protein VN605_09835 [Thermoanaerobaculia bacterium]|nr:hypothetical protein [Thermoanaerobaculia bacterium]
MSLREQAREQPKMSQIAVYNCGPVAVCRRDDTRLDGEEAHCKLLAAEKVEVDPEALLFKRVVGDAVTDDGLSLRSEAEADVRSMTTQLFRVRQGYVGRSSPVGAPR